MYLGKLNRYKSAPLQSKELNLGRFIRLVCINKDKNINNRE